MVTFNIREPNEDDGMDINLDHLSPEARALAEITRDVIRSLPEPSVLPDMPAGTHFPCPLEDCEWMLFVPELDVDDTALAGVFGMGIMASVAAMRQAESTELQLERHLLGHTIQDWARTVASLKQQRDEAMSMAREAMEVAVSQVGPTFTTPAGEPFIEPAPDGDEELRRSREAQERFDPLKATPTYKADIPEGVVGVRR